MSGHPLPILAWTREGITLNTTYSVLSQPGGLQSTVSVLRVREVEAAEQVQRSIKVAEQIKQQKTEAEFEISQLSSQVERQQLRIRALIEEQVTKVEEERGQHSRLESQHPIISPPFQFPSRGATKTWWRRGNTRWRSSTRRM